ncbi:MAG TPA: tRNA 4-thiouridine(8) synthase ThiI [Firmicutes bacterium]|nr:tRNA 4-thiouridine(8) synthase ThiI [Bacillota bacterium]
MTTKILIRYGEIALKGKNRNFFEKALHRNLIRAVRGTGAKITRIHGRFLAEGPAGKQVEIVSRLNKVFGVISVSPIVTAQLDMKQIQAAALQLVKAIPKQMSTFKVEARRSNKQFPLTSPEINRQLGAFLLSSCPRLTVDVHHPDFQLYIEISHQEAFLYTDSLPAPGGLPVGVTGKALLLLSGGIDSPVAGWMAMKRGLSVEGLHFHSFPFTGRRSQEKVKDLCRALSVYGGNIVLHMVNVAGIQQQLKKSCPEAMGIILLRRMMIRIAEAVANNRHLQAIVTGESLGQVASQTLESLQVISSTTGMLILRPLLAMDKHEIITRAKEIETYNISIQPYEDCCTLFLPRHPLTRPRLEIIEEAEVSLDIPGLIEEALSKPETITISSNE